jgi:hypothetical protein
MSEDRFNELLSCLLDGELSTEETAELAELVRGNPSREREIQAQLETAEMIALSEDELRNPGLFLAAIQSRLSGDPFLTRVRSGIRLARRPRVWRALNPWSLATAAAIALSGIGFFIWQFGKDAVIADLVRATGPIQWTGNDGMVERQIVAGKTLTGGTLELLAPDASATVEFPDHTSITVYGQSTLTMAADRRKTLHLRTGNLEANVSPQPSGQGLVVHTPVAELDVLGTQFNVTADSVQTKLAVNRGRVRLRQRSDKREVEVPAAHLVMASIDNQEALAVMPMVATTNNWAPSLARDVDHGEWISALHAWRLEVQRAMDAGEMTPEDVDRDFRTRAINIPQDAGSVYARPAGRGDSAGVSYIISLSATRGFHGPVWLAEGGRFRIQGEVQSPTTVTFAISVIDSTEISGTRHATRRRVQGRFDLELTLADFRLGAPTVSASPAGQHLVGWHCLTSDREAGLTINAVRLSGPM